MSQIDVPNSSLQNGATITALEHNQNYDTLVTAANDLAGQYKTLLRRSGSTTSSYSTGPYFFSWTGATQTSPLTSTNGNANTDLSYLDPDDYTATTLVPKLRVLGSVSTNTNTAPGRDFIFGLYPVTITGGANQVIYTIGTVTSGSEATVTAPATSTTTTANSGDFAFPSAGLFALGLSLSGAIAANAQCHLSWALQVRSV